MRRAGGLDDDIESDSAGELEQQLCQVVASGVGGLVCPESRGGGQPLVVDVDRDNTSFRRTV